MPDHAAVCASPADGNYCQVLVSDPFWLVLHLAGPPDQVDLNLGRQTLAKIEEIITQTPDIFPAELVSLIKEIFKDGVSPNLVVTRLSGAKLLVASHGQMAAKLVRQGKVINLITGAGTIAGPVIDRDLLILGTAKFFAQISSEELTAASHALTTEIQDSLSVKLESLADPTAVAALLTHLKVDNQAGLPFSASKLFLRPPRSRRSLYLLLLVFIILVSSIAFQLRSRSLENRVQTAAAIDNQARQALDTAGKLASLNDNLARSTLIQAKKEFLDRAEVAFGKNWSGENSPESRKLKAALADLDKKLGEVAHIYVLSSLDVFSDFNLLRANAAAGAAALNAQEIIILDNVNGAVYSLGTKNKTAAIIGGADDFKRPGFVDFSGRNVYVFTPAGIYSLDKTNSSPGSAKLIIKPADQWGEIRGLKTFAGNLYLLDSKNSQIWKYQNTDFGFATPSAYLRAGSVDFSKVADFSIDGSIYVLSQSGNIAKFSGGGGEDFTVSGLDVSLKDPQSLFVSDETKNIYILDAGNARVVVLDKKGIYQAQYLLPNIPNSPNNLNLILVDESLSKVFLLSGSKVYAFVAAPLR